MLTEFVVLVFQTGLCRAMEEVEGLRFRALDLCFQHMSSDEFGVSALVFSQWYRVIGDWQSFQSSPFVLTGLLSRLKTLNFEKAWDECGVNLEILERLPGSKSGHLRMLDQNKFCKATQYETPYSADAG